MFLAIAAVVYAVFGVGQLFIPDYVASTVGTSLNGGGMIATRLVGVALIGFALIFWWVRERTDSPEMTAIMRASAAAQAITLIIALYATTTGIWSTAGWSAVLLHSLLAAGFGYFAKGKRKPQRRRQA
jgi:hypothetical protein